MIKTETERKQTILIVDDSLSNREFLIAMLEDDYRILEASGGIEAIKMLREYGSAIDLMILDIVMPDVDGFEVLAVMNDCGMIEDIPVIMISSESDPSIIERAYTMHATDYIDRPFNAFIVRKRVINTLNLHARHKRLNRLITHLVYEKEKNNTMMVNILSHTVEFRNGESGMHVLNISTITGLLLQHLVKKTDRYHLTQHDISLIVIASALHDIGKISIPGKILNKPGRFTPEEFDIMKTHTIMGEQMLKDIPLYAQEPLIKVARTICRSHHERYDGRGYPDGLVGEEIPIGAQVVALADVYDALTSERCYKKAFSHEKAYEMIVNGECGAFSDLLLECLADIHGEIIKELNRTPGVQRPEKALENLVGELMNYNDFDDLVYPLQQIRKEHQKEKFFAHRAEELRFDYDSRSSIVILSKWGAKLLGTDKTVHNILESQPQVMDDPRIRALSERFRSASPDDTDVQTEVELVINGVLMHGRLCARTVWSDDETPRYIGVFGKINDLTPVTEPHNA